MFFFEKMRFFRNNKHIETPFDYPFGNEDLSDMDALVIAPHPDDESIGCGGSMVKHLRTGRRVRVIFLSDGRKGDFEARFGENYIGIRRLSSLKALEILGVTDYEFWDYPDSELWRYTNEIYQKLNSELEEFKPGVVYLPSPYELHTDHRIGAWAGWQLWKRKKQRVAFYEALVPLYPNILVDITHTAETKSRAIACYTTENFYSNYVEKTAGINRYRTSTLSRESLYAEAFVLLDENHIKKYKLSLMLLKTALKDMGLT